MSVTKEDMEKGYLLNDNANDKEVSHEGTSSDQGQPERPQEGHWHSWALGKRTSLRSIQAGLRLIRIPFFYKKRGKEYVSFPLKFSSCFPSTSAWRLQVRLQDIIISALLTGILPFAYLKSFIHHVAAA